MKNKLIVLIVASISSLSVVADEIIQLKYKHWEIDYNCDKRGFENFHYFTVKDSGTLERYSTFHQEQMLPKRCQQFKTKPYSLPAKTSQKYHRGHGVHQNIWDHSKSLMTQSNSMANIVPQAAKLNSTGGWRVTEKLTECYRDIGVVEVWGGNLWGNDTTNDFFVKSHGVVTPDYLWKVIKFPDGEVNAWLFPNDNSPTSSKSDAYLVSPKKIERLTHLKFNLPKAELNEKDTRSKTMPKGCKLS